MWRIKGDRKYLYFITAALLALLIPTLFISTGYVRVAGAVVLIAFTALFHFTVKKRSILSLYKNQVFYLVLVIAVFYLTLLYLSGIYFGYERAVYSLSFNALAINIIPTVCVVIATEILRRILLAQDDKCAGVLSFLVGIISELFFVSGFSNIGNMDRFMDVLAMAFLPSVTANVFYHHTSKRYGAKPVIAYRLIMSLYVYVITVVPRTSPIINAFFKLVTPLIAYAFIYVLYAKKKRRATKRTSKWSYVVTAFSATIMAAIVMLVSCQFSYGMIVVATPSMTGTINVGDAVIYERYEDHIIAVGDVIVFKDGDNKIVHRVDEIEKINNVVRYYTKGDDNDERDFGYITKSDIVGMVRVKVPYIGYPTIWIRSVFN